MKNFFIIFSVIAFSMLLIGWFLFIPKKIVVQATHTPQGISSQFITANAQSSKVKPMRILFIGNSYTFFHDMPGMLIKMADSDPHNKIPIVVQAITGGGLRLMDHWENGEARALLRQQDWDYVVLQQNSMWALYKDLRVETGLYLSRFVREARQLGITPVFVRTWVRQPGSTWYIEAKHARATISPEHMYNTFKEQTRSLTKKLKIEAVPLGDYWLYASQKHQMLNLYAPDGTHPHITGSYLNALIFYRFLTKNSAQTVTFVPPGLSKENAITLKEIASYGRL